MGFHPNQGIKSRAIIFVLVMQFEHTVPSVAETWTADQKTGETWTKGLKALTAQKKSFPQAVLVVSVTRIG